MIDRQMGNGIHWVQLGLPGSKTTIALANWFEDMKPGTLRGLFVGTDAFDADVERLRSAGIKIVLRGETPVGRFAKFADPDGNL